MNTDDTPEYVLGGVSSGGTYKSLGAANTVVLVGINGSLSNDKSGKNVWVNLISDVTTNRGYGFAYYIQGVYNADNGYHLLAQDELCCMTWSLSQIGDMWTNCRVNKTSGTSDFWLETKTRYQMITSLQYGDHAKTVASILNGDIEMYTFLDSGDVSFKVEGIRNGYDYDHRSGLRNPNSNGIFDSAKICKINSSDGSYQDLIVFNEDVNDQTTISTTVQVKAGDKIVLAHRPPSGASGIHVGSYCIWFFQQNLAGWKQRTT